MPAECQHGHHGHHHRGRRHCVLLERADRVEAVQRQPELHQHDQHRHQRLQPGAAGDPELAEHGQSQVEHHPGVHPDPGHREQPLHDTRYDGSATAERGPAEHHLVHRGPVPDHVEQPERGTAQDVAHGNHDQGFEQAQPERDAERAEHPVDRCQVRAGPDPELLPRGRVPAVGGDRLDPVGVEVCSHRYLRRVSCLTQAAGPSVKQWPDL
jgi:hypothetical protein